MLRTTSDETPPAATAAFPPPPPLSIESLCQETQGSINSNPQSEPSSPLQQTPSFHPLNASTSTLLFSKPDIISNSSSYIFSKEDPKRTPPTIHTTKQVHLYSNEEPTCKPIQGFTTPWGKSGFVNSISTMNAAATASSLSSSSMINTRKTINDSFDLPSSIGNYQANSNQRTRFHSLGSEPKYHSAFSMQQSAIQQRGQVPPPPQLDSTTSDLNNFTNRLQNSKYIFFETPNMIIHNLEASLDNSYTVYTFLFPNKPTHPPQDVLNPMNAAPSDPNHSYLNQQQHLTDFFSNQIFNNNNASSFANKYPSMPQLQETPQNFNHITNSNGFSESNNKKTAKINIKKQAQKEKREKSCSNSTSESTKAGHGGFGGRSKSMSNLSMPSMLSQSNINSLLNLTLGIQQGEIAPSNNNLECGQSSPLREVRSTTALPSRKQQKLNLKKKKMQMDRCKSSIILDQEIKEEEEPIDESQNENSNFGDHDEKEEDDNDCLSNNNGDCDSREVCGGRGDSDSNQSDEEARLIREIKEMQAKKAKGCFFFDASQNGGGEADLFDFCDEKYSDGRKRSSRKLDGSSNNISSSNLSSHRNKFDTKNLVKNFLNSFISFAHHPDEEQCVLDVLAFQEGPSAAEGKSTTATVPIGRSETVESKLKAEVEEEEETDMNRTADLENNNTLVSTIANTTVTEKLNEFKQGLRNFFKGKKFNRVLLKDFIFEDEFRPLFLFFLENRALSWIESGRMKDKASHLRALRNFIFVCENHDSIKSWRFRYNFVQN